MNYELRPLSLAEILDAAFRLVQTEWRTLVGFSMIMQLPLIVLATQANWLFDPFADPFAGEEMPTPEMLMTMGLTGGGIGLLYLILYPFIAGAVTAAVGNFYLGRRFELAEAARAGLHSLLRLVFAYVVYVIAIGLMILVGAAIVGLLGGALVQFLGNLGGAGKLLIGIGGFIVFVAIFIGLFFVASVSSLLAPIVVLEARGIFASVARAFALGRTSLWRLIGVIMTAGLIVGFPVFGAQVMIGFVPYLGVLVWAAFQAVGFAFTTSVAVVLYFDLRCRAENYDLELLAQQVEAGPGLGQR
jgi:hypothetical protein